MGTQSFPWGHVWVTLTCVVWVGACGSDVPPRANLASEGKRTTPEVQGCTDGTTIECHETLAQHGSVLSCFAGQKTCEDGIWGPCKAGQISEVPVPTRELGNLRLLAISSADDCTNNPCDPRCQEFVGVPDAAAGRTYEVGTSNFDWVAGSLSDLPGGLVSRGLVQPCQTAADCQFNTYCANPDLGTCAHDVCEAGDALDTACSSCADAVCAASPSCCASTRVACEHSLCATGVPLDEDCDPCVEQVCDEHPACCRSSGDWDETCVSAVTTICGATCGCCEGQTGYGDKCYAVNQTETTWTTARSSCQAAGDDWELAAISSSGENAFLKNLATGDHWLGLTEGNSVGTTSNWAWSSGDPSGSWNETTRTGLSYTNFASGEPNSTGYWSGWTFSNWKNCARQRSSDGAWTAEECSLTEGSFCEGPPLCLGEAPPPAAACSHDPCVTGAALRSNCDACALAVCEADPTCCEDSWTAGCVALVATECSAQCECGSGETSYGGHCYYVETSSKTWTEARTSCQARGTGWDLASSASTEETSHITSQYTANGSNQLWIGFQEASNRWTWSSGDPSGTWKETGGGSTLSYTNWATGEPNNSGTNCARVSTSGKWYDTSCTTTYDSLCEGSAATLSETTAVETPGSLGTALGDASSSATWGESCVEQVETVCGAHCDADDSLGSGVCLPWYPGQTDSTCASADLALGVPCDDTIVVCNHGTAEAPAGVRIVHFPANSGHYPSCEPDQGHPQMYECFTEDPIAPGACINVENCPHLTGNREVMVNPPGSAQIAECSCMDNWTLYSGGECGPPICSGGTSVATIESRPVDIIIAVDNSGSMQNVVRAVQQRLNEDFAAIIQNSGVDYRVIVVSRYGNVNIANYGCSGFFCPYAQAYSICVGSPLSGLDCPDSALETTPVLAHNAPYFYHHSTDIGSRDVLCKLLDSYDTADPYPSARSGWTSIAPSGWGAFLREEALKVFVIFTDDGISAGGGTGECAASTGFTDNLTGAETFDEALRTLAPSQFGAYESSDPDSNRNYVFHSITGMAGNTGTSTPTALEPDEAVETRCCSNSSSSARTCTANSADTTGGIRYGLAYQELSRMTGGLRYPICFNSSFDDIFNAIAVEVIEGATASCSFTLQNTDSADFDTAEVTLRTSSSGPEQSLSRAADLSDCGSDQWYFPDAADPSVVSLCPASCEEAQSSPDSEVSVEVTCDGAGRYAPHTFSESYLAQCSFEEVPQWSYLSVVVDTPGNSSVDLQIRSADSEGELAAATWASLGTLSESLGNEDCTSPSAPGCPLDVYEALGGSVDVHRAWIEVSATLNPSSDGTLVPSVREWSFTYSCPDAQ